MKIIRKILYKILGLKTYLKIVSKTYILYIRLGFGKKKYKEIHYLKEIIKPGFYCIDIGANIGYYSYFMSKYSGETGKVMAVEPVPLFAEIWKRNVKKTKIDNTRLLPYALGNENKKVKMGMPMIDGVVHHGMTKVISENAEEYEKLFEVEMKIPDDLFKNLERLDFIKVDIEGFESVAFENMKNTISKFKPLIQSELSGKENRRKVIRILSELSYEPYILNDEKLHGIESDKTEDYDGDFYFLHTAYC